MKNKFACNVFYVRPPALPPLKAGEPDGSQDFHRLMRNSKEAHAKLLGFIMSEGLAEDTGKCTLVANESRAVVICTQEALDKIRTLPFVAKAEKVDLKARLFKPKF